MTDNIDKFHKVNFPKAIPPTSKSKSEYSLLSPSVMKEFFLSYNQNVRENRQAENLRKKPVGLILDKVIKDICDN